MLEQAHQHRHVLDEGLRPASGAGRGLGVFACGCGDRRELLLRWQDPIGQHGARVAARQRGNLEAGIARQEEREQGRSIIV